MSYRIRAMTARDYHAVFSLWHGIPGIGLDEVSDSRAGIARYLKRNPGLSFVACDQGEIVGAILSGHDGRRGYLHHLAVAVSHRKTGIGTALTTHCLDRLGKLGLPKCNIFVFRSNARGRAFWRHNGWKQRSDLCLMQQKATHASKNDEAAVHRPAEPALLPARNRGAE